MGKRSSKSDAVEKARRKLAKAQIDLYLAQEERAAAITRGEREVRDARERAATREQKVTQRVERRAGAVARAEAQLHTISEEERHSRTRETRSPVGRAHLPQESDARDLPTATGDTRAQTGESESAPVE